MSTNFRKSTVLTSTIPTNFKSETTQDKKPEINLKIDSLTTVNSFTEFFKPNKLLLEKNFNEDGKIIDVTDTDWITPANNKNNTFEFTVSPTTIDLPPVLIDININKNATSLNSSEILFSKSLNIFNNNKNVAFKNIDVETSTSSTSNFNLLFNSSVTTIIDSTKVCFNIKLLI